MYAYSYENLKRITETEKGKTFVKEFKKIYDERYAGKELPVLKYTDFKRIYIDGNRTDWQNEVNERKNKLSVLQILALSDDGYIDELEEIIFNICEEFTWVYPAHSYVSEGKFNYNFIDLFSGETALALAETLYVFGNKLSVDIKDRIKISLKTKIVDVYESDTFWWEEEGNNWTSVCSACVGAVYLYCFPERFDAVKERIFHCLNHYLNGIREDGSTTEGVLYWDYGFGFFSLFYDIYCGLTGAKPDVLSSSKVKRTIKFINNADFGDNLCIPFADGWTTEYERVAGLVYTIKNLFPNDFALPKCDLYALTRKCLGYRILRGVERYEAGESKQEENGTVYYDSSEWLVSRQDKYNFVAK